MELGKRRTSERNVPPALITPWTGNCFQCHGLARKLWLLPGCDKIQGGGGCCWGCPTASGIRWLLCKSIATFFKPMYWKKKKNQTQRWPYWFLSKLCLFHRKHFLILNLWEISDADKNHICLTSITTLPQIVHNFALLACPSATSWKRTRECSAWTGVTKKKTQAGYCPKLLQRVYYIHLALESKQAPGGGWGGKET